MRTPTHIKKKIFERLNNTDYLVYSIVFDKVNRYKLDCKYSNNQLYDILAVELAKLIPINKKTNIIIDKSKSKKEEVIQFNQMFCNNLNSTKYLIDIKH